MVADLKEQWAEGGMIGNTQEETGYLSSMGRAKVLVLQDVITELFENQEEFDPQKIFKPRDKDKTNEQ